MSLRRSAGASTNHPGRWRVDIDPVSRVRTIYLPNGMVRHYPQETIAAMVLDVLVFEQVDPSRISAETYELTRALAGEDDWNEAKKLIPALLQADTLA